MIQIYKIICNEIITTHKKLKQHKKFLRFTRNIQTTKELLYKINLYSQLEEVLQITKDTVKINAAKKMPNNNSSGSDSDYILVATRR